MTTPEISRYRGYETLAPRKPDAVAEAKLTIDRILSRLDNAAEEGRPWPLP